MRIKTHIAILLLTLIVGGVAAQESDIYKLERLSVSHKRYNDMTPILTPDGIVFCSDRKQNALLDVRDFNRTLMYNIYFASRGDSIDFGKTTEFTSDLSDLANEGPFCFSPDGQQLYYTSNVIQDKRAQRRGISNNRGIFIADKDGDGWTNIKPFKHNDKLWNVAHPFISNDGKYLFFASDVPGGHGGSDIWFCEWVNGEWSTPENAGPEVNSSASDLYPYFSNTQELYFSSDRDGGVGGLDLYSSTLRFGKWRKAKVLPQPINSDRDDFSYFIDPFTSDSYFASNRGRNDDIYRLSSTIRRINDSTLQVEDEFCYRFKEKNVHRFDSLPFEFEWDFDDGTIVKGDTVDHCFEKAGVYIVKLHSINQVTGERKQESTEFVELKYTEQAYILAPETCIAGDNVNFDASNTNLPGWDITDYYWNFDDGTVGKGISTDKVFVEDGTYLVQLIVSGGTDENGNPLETCISKYIVVSEKQ